MPLAFTRFRPCLHLGLGKLRLRRAETCGVWSFSLPLLPDINELPNCQHTQLITPGRKRVLWHPAPPKGQNPEHKPSPAVTHTLPVERLPFPRDGHSPGNPRMPENSGMPGSSRIMPQFLLLPSLIPNVRTPPADGHERTQPQLQGAFRPEEHPAGKSCKSLDH